METVVDKLLEIDRKARQSIDEAQQYYENTLAEIEVERARIARDYRNRADLHVDDVRRTEESARDEYISIIKANHSRLEKALDDAYNLNREKWEQELFNMVLSRK